MRGLVALSDLYSLYTGARICTMIEGDRGFSFALVDAYTRYGTAATLPLVAHLPCAVVFVSWFHQLRRRIGLTAPDRFGDGPGWAIGSWLIPVGALWLPYRVALEMWSAATPAPADGGVGRARRWPVHLWWALFVASVLLPRPVRRPAARRRRRPPRGPRRPGTAAGRRRPRPGGRRRGGVLPDPADGPVRTRRPAGADAPPAGAGRRTPAAAHAARGSRPAVTAGCTHGQGRAAGRPPPGNFFRTRGWRNPSCPPDPRPRPGSAAFTAP
ncbi:DUF4328 domain-containing protein [Streptomyces griseoviridis]|uniref:DUF4328 domain-containing protein n=2 Tax=Streptomyces griseoviridis TaxID=45398 RepID=UPI0034400968